MVFSSVTFLFFFLPAAMGIYFLSPGMLAKNAVLLVLSLVFYAWGEARYLPLLAWLILFNGVIAMVIDAQRGRARAIALGAALAINLATLAVFKYGPLLNETLDLVGLSARLKEIPLPLGISFLTFHALSYLIDVYRGRFRANRNLWEVALYIAFFPQLIAGPIVRYKTIARRLRFRRHTFGRASAGMRMFIIGLAQKTLIADELAPLANAVYHQPHAPGLAEAWLGAGAYALQLYFDFAGYSNMAIGLGLVFGLALPRNFNLPYRSRSVTEFWRRWHMSLSSWFRDYLYIPLGGNRGGQAATYRNLIIVFLLCGLWHGAGWTFILWGVWQGAFLVLERAGLGPHLRRLPSPVAWAYALGAWVVGLVLFRAANLYDVGAIWSGMLGLNGLAPLSPQLESLLAPAHYVLMGVALLLSVVGLGRVRGLPRRAAPPAEAATPEANGTDALVFEAPRRPYWALRSIDVVLLIVVLLFAARHVGAGSYSPFLYFRF